MIVHLVDATFELFRFYAVMPSRKTPDGREVGAVRGVLGSMLALPRDGGATHVGCATDHVIESFRNRLFPGYKTGEGIPPDLWGQFPILEEALAAAGFLVWPMVEFEADDALATAAHNLASDPRVERVLILSPDKDLYQCVRGTRVVTQDRIRDRTYDAAAVVAKLGVEPASIPDYLALVGDTADGIPGIPGWGAKSASAILARHRHLEAIPPDPAAWGVTLRGAARLAASLAARRDDALLYRTLATLRTDAPIPCDVDALAWRGVPAEPFRRMGARLGFDDLAAG